MLARCEAGSEAWESRFVVLEGGGDDRVVNRVWKSTAKKADREISAQRKAQSIKLK